MEMDTDKKKRQRSSEKQIDYLIDFMMKHNTFACGKFQGMRGKKSQHDSWERLSNELNEIGPKKTSEQWRKVWKNQKLLTRKRNSELKLAQKKTGNFTPPPPLTDRENKIICIIGKESSEGLGFGEGSIDEKTLNVVHNPEGIEEVLEITNSDDHFVEENIYILNEDELGPNANVIMENADVNVEDKENDITNKNNSVIDNRKIEKRVSKTSLENELFKNLIDTNSEALFAIARSMELIAASNNNIAESIKSLRET